MTWAARLLSLLLLALFAAWGAGTATAAELRVSGVPYADILDEIGMAGNAGEGPVSFSIRNDTLEPAVLRLTIETPEPVAFVMRAEGLADPVLASSPAARTLRTHASQGPVFASPSLVLLPDETLRLTARFEAGPTGVIFPVALVTAQAQTAAMQARGTAHGLYFGAVFVLVVQFLFFARALGSRAARRFALYLIALAALNAHSHGYTLAVPIVPEEWFFPMVRGFQVAVMIAYLAFAAAFLKARERYPRLSRGIDGFCVLLVVLAVLEALSAHPAFVIVAEAMGVGFLVIGAGLAALALRDRHDGAEYFATGFAILLAGGVLNYAASGPAFSPWNEALDRATLTLQIADAFVFALAILSRTRALRAERDRAVEEQLATWRDRVAVGERLSAAQLDLTRARALAEGHRARLAGTTHDLRQPLAALRLAVDRAQALETGVAGDLRTGLDYLDGVLGETLAHVRPEHKSEVLVEAVPLQVVFDTVARMFDGEAQEKGLRLRVAPTSLTVRMPAIDLVRMVSNLVANAIRYTDRGGVLIGARRGHRARIQVLDTGRGISPGELEAVMAPWRRGDGSADAPGEGLGLAIVGRLAERNGLTLSARSVPGAGSVFTLDGLRATPE